MDPWVACDPRFEERKGRSGAEVERFPGPPVIRAPFPGANDTVPDQAPRSRTRWHLANFFSPSGAEASFTLPGAFHSVEDLNDPEKFLLGSLAAGEGEDCGARAVLIRRCAQMGSSQASVLDIGPRDS